MPRPESLGNISSPKMKHDPWAAIRQPRFLVYLASTLCSDLGSSLMQAAMAWQVYALSHSTLDLGLLGLMRFFPALGLSLVGGAAADAFNRRNVVVLAQCIPLACGVLLTVATLAGWVQLELIFGCVLFIGLASAFEGPSRSSLLPSIVREETFANAVTVATTMRQFARISGAALAGVIIAVAGVGTGYGVQAGLFVAAIAMLAFLPYNPTAASRRAMSLPAIKEGIQYVRERQLLVGIMALDMFAVIFGGAAALLPVYATDILHVGPTGYGLLAGSLQIGAFLMSGILIFRPPIEQSGRTVILMVMLFGAATIGFGLSHTLALSVLMYMLVGAFDQVSVVIRDTMIQMATPAELRGRVSAIYLLFIGASNQLGAMESGFVAAATSATFAVVSGGIGALTVAGLIGWRMPELFNYKVPSTAPVSEPELVPSKPGAPST